MSADPVLARIGEAAQLNHHQGQPAAARELLIRIWAEIGAEQGDPLHVSVLAHTMADVQDDVEQELVWDLRALAAIDLLTDERLAQARVPFRVAGLYPSAHLNLGECYRKLGDLDRARDHLRRAEAGVGALADDDYGRLVRSGLQVLAGQLS
ncbi:MAG: tetratricopeptide repeat protein [Pseudonocardia sp.]|nr:tetratricopeptide repeat protein [Pseudonocardia sp.]